jgi:hypothetical protein
MSKRGLGLICYGPTGIGKTHWGLWAPRPGLCLSIEETGFDDFAYIKEPPTEEWTGLNVSDYSRLYQVLQEVLANEHFKTILIDSLSGFQQIFFEYVIQQNVTSTRTYEQAQNDFYAYFKGPRKEVPQRMPQFTSLLTSLLNAGKNVFLLGHKQSDTEQNEAGADYKRAEIDMDEGIRNCFLKWAPNILYMSIQPNLTQVTKSVGYKNNPTITEGKTDSLGTKLIYTSTNPQNSAKNKLHLPPIIPIGSSAQETFDNFWKLVPEVYRTP